MHKPWSVPCILTSRCINPLLQRPDLCPLLSWFLATIGMNPLCEVYWFARKQKISIWNTLIIAARCNNLSPYSLQPVFPWCAWLFWPWIMCIPLFLVTGQVCVWECDDPSKCLSYLIEVFVLLAPTFCWLDWTGLTLRCVCLCIKWSCPCAFGYS